MTALNKEQLITHSVRLPVPLDVLESVNSTNAWLHAAPGTDIHICIAEHQTEGRGQRGHTWHSPSGENIYLSCRYPFPITAMALSGLSVAVSVATHTVLKNLLPHSELLLKWPNDIFYDRHKIAGILVDLKAIPTGTQAIVGMGINVNMLPAEDMPIDQPWTSIRQITGHYVDRNILCAQLIDGLLDCLDSFQDKGLSPFLEKWQTADALLGKQVRIRQGKALFQGEVCGIDPLGRLLVETEKDHQVAFAFGEASVLK